MKIILTIVALALAQVSAGTVNYQVQPKIVNGTDASIIEFPYLVSLRIGLKHQCAGSLLNDQWVLSAAHCL